MAKIEIDIKPDSRWLAEIFCEYNDEEQAQFFIEVAKIASSWTKQKFSYSGQQWFMVGRHLKDCSCSTKEARDLILDIYSGSHG